MYKNQGQVEKGTERKGCMSESEVSISYNMANWENEQVLKAFIVGIRP